MFDNPRLAIRALKGAPLSVLLALAILHGQQSDENEIASITGYSNRTVRNALKFLNDAGLVTRSKRYSGWQMEPAVRQLPLPLKLLNDGDATGTSGTIFLSPPNGTVDNTQSNGKIFLSDAEQNSASGKNFRSDNDKTATNGKFYRSDDDRTTSLPETSGKFYPSHARSSSTSSIYKQKGQSENEEEEKQNGNGKNFRSEQNRVFAMLREAGVGAKMAQELTTKKWVTAGYVQAHLAKIKQDDEPLRYAIHRIREGDTAPICSCGVCESCYERYYKRNGLSDIIQR